MKLLPVALLAVFCVAFTYAGFCELCEQFVDEIDEYIQEEEPQIEQEANQVCDKITQGHQKWDEWCQNLIDKELHAIVVLLKNNATTQEVCHLVGYC